MCCDFGGDIAMHDASKSQRSSFIAAIGQWWRNWNGNRAGRAEIENFCPDELQRIATDVGANPQELRSLAGKWPESTNLLSQRMAVLHLDADEVARSQPAVSNDLKKLCSLCVSKGWCAHDLAKGAINPDWREYCPNTTTLLALSAQRTPQANNGKKR
jgi:hypothetical protein